jgi:ABC-type phosphonate transport system ATPase subunit
VLDEATSGLDPAAEASILRALVRDCGTGVVAVSHRLVRAAAGGAGSPLPDVLDCCEVVHLRRT